VDQPLGKLTHLFEEAIHGLESIAKDLADLLLADAKRFAKLVEQGLIKLEDTLDDVLKKVFGISLADLTASTCFAETRLAPHMALKAAAPASFSDDSLNRLRQLRSDLGTSPMGRWILNIYNTLSVPLVHLYDYQPGDPDSPTFRQVLDYYNGDQVFGQLIDMLKTSGTSDPISLDSDFVTNGQYIISAMIDLANAYADNGDPGRKREALLIKQGSQALISQIPTIEAFAAQKLNYDQLKQKVAQMTPPPNPFQAPAQ